jgi:hypothetical protein
MRKPILCQILIISLAFFSCDKARENTEYDFFFNKIKTESFDKWNGLESARAYPLDFEDNKDVFIGDLEAVKYANGEIFLLSKLDHRIYRFGNKGSLLDIIGDIGQGPNEYQKANSFTVLENVIEILTTRGANSMIHKYTKTGDFISSIEIENFVGFSMEKRGDNYLIYTGTNSLNGNRHKVREYSSNGTLQNQYFEFDNTAVYPIHEQNFFKNEQEDIFFHESFLNQVYKYVDGAFQLEYSINFYPYQLTEDFYNGKGSFDEKFMRQMNKGIGLVNAYFENKEYSYLNLMITNSNDPFPEFKQIIINKKTNQQEFLSGNVNQGIALALTEKNQIIYLLRIEDFRNLYKEKDTIDIGTIDLFNLDGESYMILICDI